MPPPFAVTDTLGAVQVKIVVPELLVILAGGGVLFSVNVILALLLQPELLTVTIYVVGDVRV